MRQKPAGRRIVRSFRPEFSRGVINGVLDGELLMPVLKQPGQLAGGFGGLHVVRRAARPIVWR
jgi:hypothetical protein